MAAGSADSGDLGRGARRRKGGLRARIEALLAVFWRAIIAGERWAHANFRIARSQEASVLKNSQAGSRASADTSPTVGRLGRCLERAVRAVDDKHRPNPRVGRRQKFPHRLGPLGMKRGARRPQDLPLHEIPRRFAADSIAGVLRRQARAAKNQPATSGGEEQPNGVSRTDSGFGGVTARLFSFNRSLALAPTHEGRVKRAESFSV